MTAYLNCDEGSVKKGEEEGYRGISWRPYSYQKRIWERGGRRNATKFFALKNHFLLLWSRRGKGEKRKRSELSQFHTPLKGDGRIRFQGCNAYQSVSLHFCKKGEEKRGGGKGGGATPLKLVQIRLLLISFAHENRTGRREGGGVSAQVSMRLGRRKREGKRRFGISKHLWLRGGGGGGEKKEDEMLKISYPAKLQPRTQARRRRKKDAGLNYQGILIGRLFLSSVQ